MTDQIARDLAIFAIALAVGAAGAMGTWDRKECSFPTSGPTMGLDNPPPTTSSRPGRG